MKNVFVIICVLWICAALSVNLNLDALAHNYIVIVSSI